LRWCQEGHLSIVKPACKVLVDLVPEFESFFGAQPPLENISPQEARHRFAGFFHNFLKVVCQPEHPLVLFIDDWQWADTASFQLIGQMQVGIALRYLLVIVSYRDNEVDSSHQLLSTVDDLRSRAVPVEVLQVKNISADDVQMIVAAMLKPFVEDIRQITVGDEPITGHASRTTPTMQSGSAASKRSSGGLERRATVQSSRPRAGLGLGLDTPSSGASTPTPSGRHTASAALEKPKPIKNKRFSWTPLGFDAVDDSDWANWDSPGPSKSPRWSGSTINSAGLEEIASIPEAGEEKSTPVYVLWHEWDKKVPWLIYRRAGRTGR